MRIKSCSTLGVTLALLVPVHGCGLLPGENEPLRALYFEDPALGLPPIKVNVVSDGGSSDAGTSPNPTTLDAGSTTATERSTSEANETSTASSEEPTSSATSSGSNCPAEDNGLVLGAVCSVGVGACQRVRWVECVDSELRCTAVEAAPNVEVCNGADDDCDGEVDNLTGKCSVAEGGEQHPGVWSCARGERVCDFDPDVTVQEVCNGEDDDYNGLVDEGLRVEEGCSVGLGACERIGDRVCEGGRYTCNAVAGLPTTEECNGVDDDCDGEVDDDIAVQTCLSRIGSCDFAGSTSCYLGSPYCHVPASSIHSQNETCNGFDDDCDGETDEGFDIGTQCSAGVAACEQTGEVICADDGTATCSVSAPAPSPERCNGDDDDCDGEIDNGHVCPDPTVANALPFTSGVWLVASAASCGEQKVLQVYPEVNETTYYRDFPCDITWWGFRPSDAALTYGNFDTNTIELHEGLEGQGTGDVLAAPEALRGNYGFDAQDRPYYFGFDDVLRRGTGAGETLAADITNLYAVAADGRTLVDRHGATLLLDASGAVLKQIDPTTEFAGTMSLLNTAITVRENDTFLPYERVLPDSSVELVLLRLDASNQLSLVRRTSAGATDSTSIFHLATSDGSIFQVSRDPDPSPYYSLRRHAPDGTTSVLWREAESTFDIDGRTQLLVGPRLPQTLNSN